MARWSAAAAAGLLALLLKLPATAHLYLVLAFLLFRRFGQRPNLSFEEHKRLAERLRAGLEPREAGDV